MTTDAQETIGCRRSPHLPGVEVMDADHSARCYRVFSGNFLLVAPVDWIGDFQYRRRRQVITPGMVFGSEPGESFAIERVLRPGSFKALAIEDAILRDHARECGGEGAELHFREIGHSMSGTLRSRLARLFRVLRPDGLAIEVQSALVDLIDVLTGELVDDPRSPRRRPEATPTAARRVRECLDDEDGGRIDLASLAREVGLSRFQVLRAFKQHYGLPPHAYLVRRRIADAQILLRRGEPPAQVAAACGFVDQTHLNRHFKNVYGITAARYARGGR